jgi:glycosyltransferase involved in cell wall biosynthesis
VNLDSIFRRYRSLDLVIVGYSLFSEGGDWRSIYLYFRDAQQRGREVHLVDGRRPDGRKQLLAAAAFAPRIVVNALASLTRWPCLLVCLLRKDVFIYLHDTEYMLDNYRRSNPLRYRLIRRVLGRNPVLCVSRQAEALYRTRFGSSRTHVMYENVRVPDTASFPPDRCHVVMIGSMDERKGVDLFSRVADLAAERFRNWQFHWLGGRGARGSLYLSPRVLWHGWQPTAQTLLAAADVFFLSSIDDPCSLAALEALAMGKRCVVYQHTGIVELVQGIQGCAVYREYSPEAALEALNKALECQLDLDAVRMRVLGNTGDQAFAARLETVLGLK